ncbi:hypothetical protein GNAINCEL_00086 [Serratia phage KKP 3709]|nr:hypothetical protein GNAINCEL_00086 [Serratia phage KKP 3709]
MSKKDSASENKEVAVVARRPSRTGVYGQLSVRRGL